MLDGGHPHPDRGAGELPPGEGWNTTNSRVWRKAGGSDARGQCIEVRPSTVGVAIRDSKDPGSQLGMSAGTWAGLVQAVRAGRHDLRHPGHAGEHA